MTGYREGSENTIREMEEEIAKLKSAVAWQKATIVEREAEITRHTEAIGRYVVRLAKRDEQIAALKAAGKRLAGVIETEHGNLYRNCIDAWIMAKGGA